MKRMKLVARWGAHLTTTIISTPAHALTPTATME
jgi:hypothetical protein